VTAADFWLTTWPWIFAVVAFGVTATGVLVALLIIGERANNRLHARYRARYDARPVPYDYEREEAA
jgi:hypothetical protein